MDKGIDRVGEGQNKECTLANAGNMRCKLPSCSVGFVPKRKDQVFCSVEHKQEFYRLARNMGVSSLTSRGAHARSMASPQMKALYAAFADGQPHTTKELHQATGIENVSTAISEIRRAGVNISPAKFIRITETGAKVYAYRMEA